MMLRTLSTIGKGHQTHSCLVNLIDVTLACEDAYSKLVEVVTVDVSDKNRVGVEILKLMLNQVSVI